MWNYEKRLQYPVKITQTNPKMAQVIISQFGGPDGELAASMRYLSQRYTIVDYTGLSMRLPPKAANPKPLCCFSIDGKRKRRLFNRHLEKGIL